MNDQNDMRGVAFDELVHQTEDAVLIRIGQDRYWMPLNCVNLYPKIRKLHAPLSLLIKKGMVQHINPLDQNPAIAV